MPPTPYSGSTTCSEDLSAIFDEAANTYGVSSTLLKSIARAESNFNTSAVSSAGAVGIMQAMPATAASLGVTDSYDAYQNIMGGANLISQAACQVQRRYLSCACGIQRRQCKCR